MRNILILNQAHTTNLGDIAIGESMEKWVKESGWNPITLPFWDEKDVFGKISYSHCSALIKTIPLTADIVVGKWVKEKLDRIARKTTIDCAIIGGGELLSSHRGFNAVFSCWIHELRRRHIPCCVIGVSVDDRLSTWQINRNKKALAQCFLVAVRDGGSQKVFKQIYDIDAEMSPDAVFLFGNHIMGNTKSSGIVCVPVSVQGKRIDGIVVENDVDFYHQVIVNSLSTGDQVIFTATEARDSKFTYELCSQINNKYGTHYKFKKYQDLSEFCKLIDGTRLVVSGRMHAMILGLLYGCAPKAIPFKPKLSTFAAEYSQCDNIENVVEETSRNFKEYAEMISKAMT